MVNWFLYKKIRDGGKGSGNFGHKGRPGQVGGSAKGGGGSAELLKVSTDLNLADIDDHLAKSGIRKGDVVKVFGLRKDVLLTHAQNCMKAKEEGKFWRGVFKDEDSVQEARDLLAKYDSGELEKDAGYTKVSRSLARYDFVTGLINGEVEPKIAKAEEQKEKKIESPVKAEEPKVEPPAKVETPKINSDDILHGEGEVEVTRNFNTFSNKASQKIAQDLITNVSTEIPSGTVIKNYFNRYLNTDADRVGKMKEKAIALFDSNDKKDAEAYKNAVESHLTDLESLFEKMEEDNESSKFYLYQFARNISSMVGTYQWYERSLYSKNKGYNYKENGSKIVKGQLLQSLASLRVMNEFDKKMRAVNEDYKGIMDLIDPTKYQMSADEILKSGVIDEVLEGFMPDKKQRATMKQRVEASVRNYMKKHGNFNPFAEGMELTGEVNASQPYNKSAESHIPFDWRGCFLKTEQNYFDETDTGDIDVKLIAVAAGMLAMDKKVPLMEYVRKTKGSVDVDSSVSIKSKVSRDEQAIAKDKKYMDDFTNKQIGQIIPNQSDLNTASLDAGFELALNIKNLPKGLDVEKFKEKVKKYKENNDVSVLEEATKDMGFWLGLTDKYEEPISYGDVYKKFGKLNDMQDTLFKRLNANKSFLEGVDQDWGRVDTVMQIPIAVNYAKRVGEDFEKLNQANSHVIDALNKSGVFKGENVFQLANDIVTQGHLSHVFGKNNKVKTSVPFTFDMASDVSQTFEKGDMRAYASICMDAFKKAGLIKENRGVMNTSQNRLLEGYQKASQYSDVSNDFVNTAVKIKNDETNYDKSLALAKENIKKMFPNLSNIDELMDGQKLQANSKPKNRGQYGKSIDDVSKWREHLQQFMDDKTGSKSYVWSGDDMQYLVSAMTMGGGNYNDIKEYDQFGSQSFMNSIVANSPNTEVPLYRFENMQNGYRNYDLKVGDSVQFDSQHFTWSEDFAMNSASEWFGEGAPVLFRINGKKPFYNFEQRVGKGYDKDRASMQCKGVVEYEGSLAGNCKITGQSKMTLSNGLEAVVYDCDYDYDSRETFTNLNLKQFAYLNNMYGEEGKNDKKG